MFIGITSGLTGILPQFDVTSKLPKIGYQNQSQVPVSVPDHPNK